MKQTDEFIKKALRKAIFPCMLAILGSNINLLVDGIVVGQRLGADGLAALNLCTPVYLILCVVGSFIVSGTAIMASEKIGKNENKKSVELYHISVGLCLVSGVIITAVGLISLNGIAHMLCNDSSLYEMVRAYAGVTLAGSVFNVLLYIPFWFLRIDGRNMDASVVMLVMAGTNIVLDIVFMYPLSMGVFGAALASVISTMLAVAAGFCFLCSRRSSFPFGIKFSADRDTLKCIAKYGSSGAMNNFMQSLRIFFINTLLLSSGGSLYVAMFSSINCISEFSLCILSGVPQAANAMLGIYYGEHDCNSVRILMKRQVRSGLTYCTIYGTLIVLLSGPIASIYGLKVSLLVPMICLALSLFPGIINTILIGNYTVSGNAVWANVMVILRVLIFAVIPLYILNIFHLMPWLFMIFSEALTLLFWLAAGAFYHHIHHELSRYLFINDELEKSGRVMNFSVEATSENACNASERISEFCEENGMKPGQVIKIQLAVEEILVRIIEKNENHRLTFDIRAFAVSGVNGIRIRYDGISCNPFLIDREALEDEADMGIRMIGSLSESVTYQRTFGVNTLRILV